MSRIHKRNKIWHYSRGNPNSVTSVRKSLKTTSKTVAQELQKALDLRYARIELGIETETVVTLDYARNKFIEHIAYKQDKDPTKKKSNTHYAKQVRETNLFVDFCKPSKKMNRITPSVVMDYKSYLLKNKGTPKTARNYLLTLREFLDFSYNKAYLGIPIFRNLGNKFLPSAKPTKKRRPIPLRVIKDVIKNAPTKKDRIYWTVLLYTLLRTRDAGTLSMNDIVQGKYQDKTKEPIPLILPESINPEDAVNIYPRSYDRRTSRHRYQRLMKDRGYETDLHAIRHSVATHLARCGYKEEDIKRITNHHSTAVDNYIHTGEKELLVLLNNLN